MRLAIIIAVLTLQVTAQNNCMVSKPRGAYSADLPLGNVRRDEETGVTLFVQGILGRTCIYFLMPS